MQSEKPDPRGPKGVESPTTSDAEKKAPIAAETGAPAPQGISAVAVLWTFGKCLGALLPVYLAGYYRVSTSLLAFGMMVYTGWKHAREAKEARLKSAIQFLSNEEENTFKKVSKIRRELPAWVRNEAVGGKIRMMMMMIITIHQPSAVGTEPTLTYSNPG